jgi:hypothetical protein
MREGPAGFFDPQPTNPWLATTGQGTLNAIHAQFE